MMWKFKLEIISWSVGCFDVLTLLPPLEGPPRAFITFCLLHSQVTLLIALAFGRISVLLNRVTSNVDQHEAKRVSPVMSYRSKGACTGEVTRSSEPANIVDHKIASRKVRSGTQ